MVHHPVAAVAVHAEEVVLGDEKLEHPALGQGGVHRELVEIDLGQQHQLLTVLVHRVGQGRVPIGETAELAVQQPGSGIGLDGQLVAAHGCAPLKFLHNGLDGLAALGLLTRWGRHRLEHRRPGRPVQEAHLDPFGELFQGLQVGELFFRGQAGVFQGGQLEEGGAVGEGGTAHIQALQLLAPGQEREAVYLDGLPAGLVGEVEGVHILQHTQDGEVPGRGLRPVGEVVVEQIKFVHQSGPFEVIGGG